MRVHGHIFSIECVYVLVCGEMIDNMVLSLALIGRSYRFDISNENIEAVLKRKYSSSSHWICYKIGVLQISVLNSF